MKTKIIGLVVLLGAVAGVRGDEVWVGKLPYQGVQITGYTNGFIEFEIGTQQIRKANEQVSRIVLSGSAQLNRAEELLSAGKYAEAVQAYRECLVNAKPGWKRDLVRARQLLAEHYKQRSSAPKPPESRPAKAAEPNSSRIIHEETPSSGSQADEPGPEDLLKDMPEPPDCSEMTSLQAELARTAYLEKLKTRRESLVGRKVSWKLRVKDVSREGKSSSPRPLPHDPAPGGTSRGVVLKAVSELGTEVEVVFPESRLPELAKLPKNEVVRVSGEVIRWDGTIRLRGASVDLTGARYLFFGVAEPGDHNVFLVDKSGSMMETFDIVRTELRRTIKALKAEQSFHVVFFSWGPPKELPEEQLVYATEGNKQKALEGIDRIQPSGQTDPFPALERAFEALKQRRGGGSRCVVFLLTDGDFEDNDRVVARIRELNKGRKVKISTILYRFHTSEAKRVLQQIATENGGNFRFVTPLEWGD